MDATCCSGRVVPSTPFVGREPELSRIHVAVGEGKRLVLVLGDAGVGKTRLVGEALRRSEGVLQLGGACLSLTNMLPLLPIADALGQLGRVDAGRLIRLALDATPQYVRPEIGRLLPEFGDTRGVESTTGEGWRRERLFAALGALLAEVGRQRGVALVVEDLHWADSATLDCLTYLSRGDRGNALTAVVTCRSDESRLDPLVADWLVHTRRGQDLVEIRLLPLSKAEVADQAAGITGGRLPTRLVDELYARAEGNPFFTEQLVVAATIDSPDRAVRLPSRVPTRLADLLVARTRDIGGDARAVLASLAVAARPLTEAQLVDVTGVDAVAVRDALRELAAARLLAADTADDPAHRLSHALLAEAVAAALLPGERVSLHVRVAEALERLGEASVAPEVAAHWRAAGHPLNELRARVAAAEAAERIFAYDQAAAHWQRAIELWKAIPRPRAGLELPSLYVRAIDALDAHGEGVKAGQLADEARLRFADYPNRWYGALVLHRAARFKAIESTNASLPLIKAALRLFEDTPASADHAAALFDYYLDLRMQGRHEEGLAALRRAREVAEAAGANRILVRILSHLAHQRVRVGETDDGFRLFGHGWSVAEASGDTAAILWMATAESDVLLKLGRLADATNVALRGLDMARHGGRQGGFEAVILIFNAAEGLIGMGRTTDAAELVDPETEGPPERDRWILHQMRAELDLLRGDVEAATQRLQQTRTLPVGGNVDFNRELAQRIAEVAVWARRPRDALDQVEQVLERLVDTDVVPFSGWLLALGMRACADLSESARARRDAEGVDAALAAADRLRAWLERMGGTPFDEHPFIATIPADRATWEAERTRLTGDPDPMAWTNAAKLWEGLGRPHRAAYAWWRHAEAQLARGDAPSQAAAALRTAAVAADGAAPLLREISALAARARIALDEAPTASAETKEPVSAPATSYRLTDRELLVLRLLAAGRTNAEIGAALFISPKTASVHVTNILRKLGVTNRVQAATVAERAGLLADVNEV
jgi:ATP/maltotriose-dependent transcriptional regulator MalT